MRAFRKKLREMHKATGVVYSRHHRKPVSLDGSDDGRNISIIPKHSHEAWHTLFSNHTPETICAIINEKYLDPDYVLVCTKRA